MAGLFALPPVLLAPGDMQVRAPANLLTGFVVFHNNGGWWLDRWQHPFFRHCYAVVVADGLLLRLDGAHGVLINECIGTADQLEQVKHTYVTDFGAVVLSFEMEREKVRWPMCWATCVGMAKLMMGVNRPLILTPFQLYRYLTEVRGLAVYKPS